MFRYLSNHPSDALVNLALAFSRRGLRTGILDADIFGPSIPTILDLSGEPRLSAQNLLLPLQNYGLKTMSMGYLLPSEKAPVAWRGLMVMKAIQQLLYDVEWGGLDMLVLDMPPGTGDIQLTIGQQLVLDGAIIVTTPQDVALKDAVKGVEMFKKMDIPILGMVQNMSVFVCPSCGEETHIFPARSTGGVHQKCVELGTNVLGTVPLDAQICEDADRGKPTIVAEEGTKNLSRSKYFFDIADKVSHTLGL